tara:strand:- start:114 stop:470 length:357 start_codon:yes stop_codon:yes gene_type:complete
MKFLNKEEKMDYKYYLYYGISLHDGEGSSFTIGYSEDPRRRSYEKHMSVVWMKGYRTKAEVLEAEKAILDYCNDTYDHSYVCYGAWEMTEYRMNRGWDWFIISEDQEGPLLVIKEMLK